jgi:hypothetical protein
MFVGLAAARVVHCGFEGVFACEGTHDRARAT